MKNRKKPEKVIYNPEFIDISKIPTKVGIGSKWKQRFDALPEGKAGKLSFNNRQRAYQVVQALGTASRTFNFPLKTRVIRADMAIHGEEGWLVYFWKNTEGGQIDGQ